MKIVAKLLVLAIALFSFDANAQKNLTLLSTVTYPGTLAGVWHYTHNGKEYALVGTNVGISIVDVSVPTTPLILFTLPGVTSLWHEVKVWGDYAYAVSEGVDTTGAMNGLQVINLSYLPDSAPNHFWKGDGAIAGLLANAHSVTADNGYVYINGHRISSLGDGVIIASLQDPWNPHYVGAETLNYCHDSYVRGDTMYTSDIYAGQFSIFNIANRATPVLLATQSTPFLFNHNTWLSDDGHYLYTTDEKSGAPIASFDVSDFNNIQQVDLYYTINMQPAEGHNVRVLNDYIINASYGSQVTIIDGAHPDNLIEVGNYPTGNSLCWDADPYLPSGIILATDMNAHTLYLFMPTYVRACYLEGLVTDSVTGQSIFNAHVDSLASYVHDSTDLTGHYKTGIADAGTYTVQYSKAGYKTKTVSQTLTNGVLSVLDVQLVPINIGVNDVNSEPMVKIRNNPSSNIVIEISPGALKSSVSLNLVLRDETGRIVLSRSAITESTIYLDKNSLTAGVYYFFLEDGKKTMGSGKVMFFESH